MTNELAAQSSPYLQSHSDDPVDWRGWGAGAFETAKREGNPVMLSVGYDS